MVGLKADYSFGRPTSGTDGIFGLGFVLERGNCTVVSESAAIPVRPGSRTVTDIVK